MNWISEWINWLAACDHRRESCERVIGQLERTVNRVADNRYIKGLLLLAQKEHFIFCNDIGKAKQKSEEFIEMFPCHVDGQLKFAMLCLTSGQKEEAKNMLRGIFKEREDEDFAIHNPKELAIYIEKLLLYENYFLEDAEKCLDRLFRWKKTEQFDDNQLKRTAFELKTRYFLQKAQVIDKPSEKKKYLGKAYNAAKKALEKSTKINFDNILFYALQNNMPSLALYIIELRGNDDEIFKKNKQGLTPMDLACAQGYVECVSALLRLKKFDVNSLTDNGTSYLMIACNNKRLDVLNFLLDSGANIGIESKEASCEKRTIVHYASQKGHTKCLKSLFFHPKTTITADIIRKLDKNRISPLMTAASQHATETAQFLLAWLKENEADEKMKENWDSLWCMVPDLNKSIRHRIGFYKKLSTLQIEKESAFVWGNLGCNYFRWGEKVSKDREEMRRCAKESFANALERKTTSALLCEYVNFVLACDDYFGDDLFQLLIKAMELKVIDRGITYTHFSQVFPLKQKFFLEQLNHYEEIIINSKIMACWLYAVLQLSYKIPKKRFIRYANLAEKSLHFLMEPRFCLRHEVEWALIGSLYWIANNKTKMEECLRKIKNPSKIIEKLMEDFDNCKLNDYLLLEGSSQSKFFTPKRDEDKRKKPIPKNGHELRWAPKRAPAY